MCRLCDSVCDECAFIGVLETDFQGFSPGDYYSGIVIDGIEYIGPNNFFAGPGHGIPGMTDPGNVYIGSFDDLTLLPLAPTDKFGFRCGIQNCNGKIDESCFIVSVKF